MTRDLESVRFELEYWKSVNAELAGVHGDLLAATEPLVLSAIHLVTLAVVVAGTPAMESLEIVSGSIKETLGRLRQIQEKTLAIGELLDGRVLAIREENDLPDDEPEDDPA